MNKVTLLIVAVILCIATFTVVIISFSYNNSNNSTPMPNSTSSPTSSPTPNVKITNFICTGIWHGTKLGASLDLFSFSYTNHGMVGIESLTVTLNSTKTNEKDTDTTPNTTYNPNEGFLDEYINGVTYELENLKAGETKTFEKTYFMWGAYKYVEPFVLTATLKSNSTILDKATIMIPISG